MNVSHSFLGSMALSGAFASPEAREELCPASHVELPRYMGAWRIIATTDNKAERDFFDAVETYRLRPDGNIDVDFKWRDRSFDAPVRGHQFRGKVADHRTNARWQMRLLPVFSASYVILEIGKDYQWAVVGHPSRKFGWVMARERILAEPAYAHAMRTLQSQGYDINSFRKVPQVRASSKAALTPVPCSW